MQRKAHSFIVRFGSNIAESIVKIPSGKVLRRMKLGLFVMNDRV